MSGDDYGATEEKASVTTATTRWIPAASATNAYSTESKSEQKPFLVHDSLPPRGFKTVKKAQLFAMKT